MDNKVTKKRLSEFMAYEWILILIVCAAAILVWELIYTMAAVRLTAGQSFKYYYDQSITSSSDEEFYALLTDEDNPTFSYDVLQSSMEGLSSTYNVLYLRLTTQDGDILITDCKEPAEDATDKTVRIKSNVDSYMIYDFESLLNDGKDYLKEFLREGITGENAMLTYSNLDEQKIEANFRTRMKKDNRYRKESNRLVGIQLEKQRIEKLCKDLTDFQYLIENYSSTDLFYRYTRYEQSYNLSSENDKEVNLELYQKEKDEGRENLIYGLNVSFLTGGINNPSQYFRMVGETSADNVVITVFDFKDYQKDLQFETVSFIVTVVKACSNFIV